jgi:hypothetical protein
MTLRATTCGWSMISSIRQMLAHGAPASFRRFSHVFASSLDSAD